jgi:hypothetical protein
VARAITLDDMRTAGDIMFHRPSVESQSLISSRVHEYFDRVRDIGNDFVQNVKRMYDDVQYSNRLNLSEVMKQRFDKRYRGDIISGCSTIREIQQAPPVMRRWIMAQPDIRDRYNAGGVSGYDKDFVNGYPEQESGSRHYDYRRVMNGVINVVDDVATSTQWIETINQEDDLSTTQKSIIRNSWLVMQKQLEECGLEDPTSIWNGLL